MKLYTGLTKLQLVNALITKHSMNSLWMMKSLPAELCQKANQDLDLSS